MCEFVQDDVGVLGPLAAVEQRLGAGNVHVLDESGVVPVGAEPCCARVILHGVERFVMVVEPDREFLQILHLGIGENVLDALQVVGQRLEDLFFKFPVLLLEQLGIDLDGPALKFFRNRIVKLFFLLLGYRLAKRPEGDGGDECGLFDVFEHEIICR